MSLANPQTTQAVRLAEIEEYAAGPKEYFALLKPRVMSLVVLTALAGMLAAPGSLHPIVGFASLLAIAVGAGASGALNMWWDADIDALMARTRLRPVPAGLIAPGEALAFGLTLSLLSVLTLAVVANFLAAALLAFAIFFYVVVYTMWLKRTTPQNIVIGGAAGAVPPLVAWAAMTGSLSGMAFYLFAIVFFWTPPHFWALSILMKDDYAAARIPMLPVVAGEDETRRQIMLYTVLLYAVTQLPFCAGGLGVAYLVPSMLLGAGFIGFSYMLLRTKERRWALRTYLFSLAYLALLFVSMAVAAHV